MIDPRSVAEVNDRLRNLIEGDSLLQQLWIVGEVSSAKEHRSGIFFTLKDPDADAAVNCVVWRSQLERLKTIPQVGERVIILASASIYAPRGDYRFQTWQIVSAGAGMRALLFQQLQRKLAAEGLFDPLLKRSLPKHPRTIAIVTSPTAAAWGDIQLTLRQRYPGVGIILSPASVQGDRAPLEIVRAIERVEIDGKAEVLILARGGGATEDLVCFNDERVVRAVANCQIPVVTGIGHQRDESLADLAADVCAHTPTAAAEMVVPLLANLRQDLTDLHDRLFAAISDRVTTERNRLRLLRKELSYVEPQQQIKQRRQELEKLQQRSVYAMERYLQRLRHQRDILQERLKNLDPQAILDRGYAAILDDEGTIVKSKDKLQSGETIVIRLADGMVSVKIENISEK
jgi:exodeoxyribonuclease VII large subunit